MSILKLLTTQGCGSHCLVGVNCVMLGLELSWQPTISQVRRNFEKIWEWGVSAVGVLGFTVGVVILTGTEHLRGVGGGMFVKGPLFWGKRGTNRDQIDGT